MASKLKRIAISTGGGDAPGLNAVIRAVTVASEQRGCETFGIRDGFRGILEPEEFPEGGLIPLTLDAVRGITHLGGTIIGSTNRGNPIAYPKVMSDGSIQVVDRTDELVTRLQSEGIDALIVVGGDGTMAIADVLSRKGMRVIGIPKTIDNDLDGTVLTFGFDSAVSFATECLDRLHSTAAAHRRVIVVEVMGRYAGWIALHSGIAGSADAILIPEIPFNLESVAKKIADREAMGRRFAIVVVAEGAFPVGGGVSVKESSTGGGNERLGGVGEKVSVELQKLTGKETRFVVLGHLLRGGTPTASDRLLSLRFGTAAIRALESGMNGVMVALHSPSVEFVPLSVATQRMKRVALDSDTIQTARDLGICFGD